MDSRPMPARECRVTTHEGSRAWMPQGSPQPVTRLLTGEHSSRKQSRVSCLCLCLDSSDSADDHFLSASPAPQPPAPAPPPPPRAGAVLPAGGAVHTAAGVLAGLVAFLRAPVCPSALLGASRTSQPLDPHIRNLAAEMLTLHPRAERGAHGDGAPRLHPRFPRGAEPRCPQPLAAGQEVCVCWCVLGCAEWTRQLLQGRLPARRRRERRSEGLLGSARILMLGTGTGTGRSASPHLTLARGARLLGFSCLHEEVSRCHILTYLSFT